MSKKKNLSLAFITLLLVLVFGSIAQAQTCADGQVPVWSSTLKWTCAAPPVVWGGITGTVSNQTDLQSALNGKVPTTTTVNGKALSSNITLTLASADFANQGTTTTVLHGNAAGNPSFGSLVNADIAAGTIDLTTKVTGILPTANGGTGVNNFTFSGSTQKAATASGTLTSGDCVKFDASGNVIDAGAPCGTGSGSGTVTSVGLSTNASYLTIGSSPVTTSGTITVNKTAALAGNQVVATPDGVAGVADLRALVNGDLPTVNVAHGGTGLTTLTANNVILGNGTTAPLFVAPGTSGNLLTSNGTTWTSATPAAGGTVTSVATTSPITGGPITTTGTIACATCTTSASALTANSILKGSGGQAMATSSLTDNGTLVTTGEHIDLTTNAIAFQIANAGTTGTTLNKLAKLTGAPSTAVITATTDTTGILGVVIGGAGTTGNASIAIMGQVQCVFDGATTAGNYVINSSTVAGDCKDGGSAFPNTSLVLGRILSTNAAGGTFTMEMTTPDASFGTGGNGKSSPGGSTNDFQWNNGGVFAGGSLQRQSSTIVGLPDSTWSFRFGGSGQPTLSSVSAGLSLTNGEMIATGYRSSNNTPALYMSPNVGAVGGLEVRTSGIVAFSNTTDATSNGFDVAISRTSAGKLEVDDGTNSANPGTVADLRDLLVRQHYVDQTITATGTTGNQTINKAAGTVNIAAAGTTVTVTNSLVSTSSTIYCVIRTNDSTATIKNVVPSSGSFVINLSAAATAEVSIGFFVVNK